MFLIRTAFWLGIIVTVMPTDPESQQRMKLAARDGLAHLSTTCERHQDACRHGSVAWSTFKTKAEAAGRMAFGLAMEQMSGSQMSGSQMSGNRPSGPADVPGTDTAISPGAQGTLQPTDRAPQWRAADARGRS